MKNRSIWKDKYDGEKIKVKATVIKEEVKSEKSLGYESGALSQGRLGKTTTVKIYGKISVEK